MKQTPWLLLGLGLLVQCCKNPKENTVVEKAPTQPAVFEYSCRGTEPFWLIEIYPDSIVYQRAGGKKILYPYVKAQTNGDSTFYLTQTILYKEDTSRMTIKIVPDSCSDGMSDHRYPFTSIILRDGEILHGCAVNEKEE